MHGPDYAYFHFFGLMPLLLWIVFVTLPFAIGNYFLAGRLGRNRALWVILTIIPVVNWFFFIYVGYSVVLHVLDRLSDRRGAAPQSSSPA